MAQIRFPTQEAPTVREGKKGGGQLGQLAGAVLGGTAAALGGPVGWAAVPAIVGGAAGGSSLGGLIGESVNPSRQGSASQGPAPTQGLQANIGAVDRRLNEIQQNPHFQLQQAKAALPQLPKELQQQYAPTIEMALEASRKAQQVGRQA